MPRKTYTIAVSEIDSLLTSRQVSTFLNVDIKTVQAWAANGILPAWRLGNRYLRFRPTDVEGMVTRLQAPPFTR